MSRRHKQKPDNASAAKALASSLSTLTGMNFSVGAHDPSFANDRAVSVRIVAPSSIYNGRVPNSDPVLSTKGYGDICLYDRMERQFPTYAGVCNLFADKVCANDLVWKPGDPSVGRSREMADLTRTEYRLLRDKHIVNRKAVKGRFYGFTAIGKAGWKRREQTGLNVAHDVYDIPHRYIDFKEDGTALVKSERNFNGTPIPDGAVMFYRSGSRFTPWGEADAQFCWLPLWFVQQARQMKFQALETLGRPIPWIEVPDTLTDEQYNTMELGIQKQYKYYVITRTSSNRTVVTFPSMNILANGSAGRSEQEIERYHYGEVYIFVLGVQMTQDKTGGSRALEDSRLEVIADKTPAALMALSQMWQDGWSDQIWDVNAPNEPRALRPICEPGIQSDALNAQTVVAISGVLNQYARNEIPADVCERMLVIGGVPDEWAHNMVESMEKAKADGSLVPASPQRLPQQNDAPQEDRDAA